MERPILFSTAMVQAILAGRKTQTRRIIKGIALDWLAPDMFSPSYVAMPENGLCPYGKPGDLIYVRETWVEGCEWDGNGEMPPLRYWYKADSDWSKIEWHDEVNDGPTDSPRWRASIHMPKAAARIWLEVTDIKIERLQDISEEDAKAEGVLLHERGRHWLNYEDQKHGLTQFIYNRYSAKASFQTLWSLINGRESFFANPWVWVVSFKVISTTGKPIIHV